MSTIDVEKLLAEVSEESPCGENLEYDPAYIELGTMAQGTPERVMGDEVIPGEEPNWRDVRDRCLELLDRTKDLRVVMYLSVAMLKMEGLTGMRDAFAVLGGVLDRYWEGVYPQLDPEDDNDPTERVNIIDSLSKPPRTDGDPMKFQQRLHECELCNSKQVGRFSLRDIAVANGDIAPTGDETATDRASIDAAFMDTDIEELQANAQAVSEAIDLVKSIEDGITERVGAGNAPNLSSFVVVLQEADTVLTEYLARRGVGEPTDTEGGLEAVGEGGAQAAVQGISGEIRSREDVIRVLDKACDYYQRNEPSSPIPLLLTRAKRLAAKNFLDIIRDLSPEAMAQIELISGIDNQDEEE